MNPFYLIAETLQNREAQQIKVWAVLISTLAQKFTQQSVGMVPECTEKYFKQSCKFEVACAVGFSIEVSELGMLSTAQIYLVTLNIT